MAYQSSDIIMISWAAAPERIIAHNTLNIDRRLFVEESTKTFCKRPLYHFKKQGVRICDVVLILELYDHIFVDCYDDFRAYVTL